jgi:hypothetical protein
MWLCLDSAELEIRQFSELWLNCGESFGTNLKRTSYLLLDWTLLEGWKSPIPSAMQGVGINERPAFFLRHYTYGYTNRTWSLLPAPFVSTSFLPALHCIWPQASPVSRFRFGIDLRIKFSLGLSFDLEVDLEHVSIFGFQDDDIAGQKWKQASNWSGDEF